MARRPLVLVAPVHVHASHAQQLLDPLAFAGSSRADQLTHRAFGDGRSWGPRRGVPNRWGQ